MPPVQLYVAGNIIFADIDGETLSIIEPLAGASFNGLKIDWDSDNEWWFKRKLMQTVT
jgi:hypothetical protein